MGRISVDKPIRQDRSSPPSSADTFNDMMCSSEIEDERVDLKAGALGFVAVLDGNGR